jgi:NADPH:quinone reductase-like Zn-dependent oxidoreductase
MRRWILKAGATTTEGLVEDWIDRPEPGPGQVRVRIVAASLNYREHLVLGNAGGVWRADIDLVPVADGAGVIDAVGEGVEKWTAGDRVVTVYLKGFNSWPPNADMGMGLASRDEQGVLAEYVILDAERVTRAPASLTLEQASTLPCAALTAWTALQQAHPIADGDTVLTLGTGGVSLFAIGLAKALGARVYATSSRADVRDRLIALGVTETFDYKTDADWGKTVFAATGGIDKVVNTAGMGSMNQSLEAMAFGGDVAVVGLMTFGDVIDPGPFLAKGATLRGIPVGSRDGLDEMITFIDAKGLKPIIHKTFEFGEARAAYAAQLSADLFGKIVIRVTAE